MEASVISKGKTEQEHKVEKKKPEKDSLKEEKSSETITAEKSPGPGEKLSRKTKSKRNREYSPSPEKIQDKPKEKDKQKNLSSKRRSVKSSIPYEEKLKPTENTQRQKITVTKKPKPKPTQTQKQQSTKKPNQYVTRTYPASGSKSAATGKSANTSDANLEATNEETATTEVKQFSFPYHKILSGASVAPVKMYPQKIQIKYHNYEDEEGGFRHWIDGLFQTTKMSLKLRLLRLFLVWVFFRVLNKQTSWISERLGIGVPDEIDPRMKPPKPRPGERYIKVFHESSPHPIHVRVKNDQGFNPNR